MREFCKVKNERAGNRHIFIAVLTGGGDRLKGLDATQKANCKEPASAAATLGNQQL